MHTGDVQPSPAIIHVYGRAFRQADAGGKPLRQRYDQVLTLHAALRAEGLTKLLAARFKRDTENELPVETFHGAFKRKVVGMHGRLCNGPATGLAIPLLQGWMTSP